MYKVSVLARTLVSLRSNRRTGVFTVETEGVRTYFYLKQGTLVFAEEGTNGETLGRLLVRQKQLTQQQYLDVISKMTDALVFNEQLRFGEVAVELGYLAEDQVSEALEEQVRWRVIRCLQRPVDAWKFEESESRLDDIPTLSMPLESLFYQAVSWMDTEQRRDLELERVTGKYPFAPAAEHRLIARRFRLSDAGAELLSLFNGQRTTKEILAMSSQLDLDVEAIVLAMYVLSTCKFADAPEARPRRPEEREPASRAAPPVTPPTPPVATGPAFAKMERTRASQTLKRISAETAQRRYSLEDGDLFREPNTAQEAKLLAETAFQRGKGYLTKEVYSRAQRALDRAVALDAANTEFKLYAAACRFIEQGAMLPAAELSALSDRCREALRLDPNSAFAHYILGRIAFQGSDLETAQRRLARALKLDPSLVDASRLLRITVSRLGSKKH